MIKLLISGKEYTAENEMSIRPPGHLFTDDVDQGLISHECSIITISGVFDQSQSIKGILKWVCSTT